MGRPSHMSIYADERTQQIFDEFTKVKGITKSTALTEMLEIYMLSQDEKLYIELKKKYHGVEVEKKALIQRTDIRATNDYIFMKLGISYDVDNNLLDGYDTIKAYIRNCNENGLGHSWFSTDSLYYGMAKDKIEDYNSLVTSGETVKILFAVGEGVNDEKAKIWIKIKDIKEEHDIKAQMLKVRSTGKNLKQVITKSQYNFGYVYLPEE